MNDMVPGLSALPQTSAHALSIAPRLCSTACRSYHAVWGFLRLLGDLPAVASDHKFLMGALSDAIDGGARQVLISGSADHGLLAYVLAAYDAAGVQPEVTVIDRCETPLKVCKKYAADIGHDIQITGCDALTYSGRTFDLIVAHNFFNFFSPDDRSRLVRNWANLLDVGGRAISVSTVKPDSSERGLRFDPSEAEALANRMCTELEKSAYNDLISQIQLRELVMDYAARRSSWNLQSLDIIRALFVENGFDLNISPDVIEHTERAGRSRVGIVATRA